MSDNHRHPMAIVTVHRMDGSRAYYPAATRWTVEEGFIHIKENGVIVDSIRIDQAHRVCFSDVARWEVTDPHAELSDASIEMMLEAVGREVASK